MSKSIIVTRPNYDITTNYLFHWTQPIISFSINRQVRVYDLHGSKAARANLESYRSKRQSQIICLNGHGSANSVAGQDEEVLIDSSDKHLSIYKGTIIYARSCQSASKLGSTMVKKGTSAYIGYKNDFIFFRDNNYLTRPLRDPTAKYFLEPSNLIMTTLIKGHTVKEADKRSKRSMRQNFLKLLTSISSADDRDMAPFLWSNIKAQVVIGDLESFLR